MNRDPAVLEYLLLVSVCLGFVFAWLFAERRRARSIDAWQQSRGAPDPVREDAPDPVREQLDALGTKVAAIESEVDEMSGHLDDKASKADVEDVARTVQANHAAIERIARAVPDMQSHQRGMNDKVTDLAANVAATRESVRHVQTQVDRIMDAVVPKGMSK